MMSCKQQHLIQIPKSDSNAIHNALTQSLTKHKDQQFDALSTSLLKKFALITEVLPDDVYNGSLTMCDELSVNSSECSISSNESSAESIDEEDELLDFEAWKKVEKLRVDVAQTAKQVRRLRRDVPQRSVLLAQRDMNQCLEDKEASLRALQRGENLPSENEKASSSFPTLELENMQASLAKLATILKCGEEDVLTGEKIEKLQNTLDAVEVGLQKMHQGEPNALDSAMMSVTDEEVDKENRDEAVNIMNRAEELTKNKGLDDPYDVLAQYVTR